MDMEINGAIEATINVQQIMDDIKAEIKEKHLTDDLPAFEDVTGNKNVTNTEFDFNQLSEASTVMNSYWKLTPFFPLTGNPIKVFLKRVSRKLVKFLLTYLCDQQTTFNANATRATNQMQAYIRQHELDNEQINVMQEQIKELSGRIKKLEEK